MQATGQRRRGNLLASQQIGPAAFLAHAGSVARGSASRQERQEFIILFIWLTIAPQYAVLPSIRGCCGRKPFRGKPAMLRVWQAMRHCRRARGAWRAVLWAGALAMLAGCTGTGDIFSSTPAAPPQTPATVGTGEIKVGLILPLSAPGNAGVAAQSMKNAADMALAEFNNPNIQLLIKDDGGT